MDAHNTNTLADSMLTQGKPEFGFRKDCIKGNPRIAVAETCTFFKMKHNSAIVRITKRNAERVVIGVRYRVAAHVFGKMLWVKIPQWIYNALSNPDLDGPYTQNSYLIFDPKANRGGNA